MAQENPPPFRPIVGVMVGGLRFDFGFDVNTPVEVYKCVVGVNKHVKPIMSSLD